MNKPTSKTTGVRLPQRVSRLISVDMRSLSPETIKAMPAAEVAVLKKIVARTVVPEGPFRFDKALSALVQKEQSAEVCALLKNVVAGNKENSAFRSLAASKLALMPQKDAERALVQSLAVTDPLVKSRVIKSLGCIGGKTALEKLNTLREPAQDFVKKQLLFAKTLIAYRLGLDEEYLPFHKGKERKPGGHDELVKLSLRKLNKKKVEGASNRLNGTRYGILLSKETGFVLTAGRSTWALFLNQELQGLGLFSAIKNRKLITGLLSLYDTRTDTYSPQYVVLTNPVNKGIEIMVVRTDGEVFYSGKADASKGIMNFNIQDIDRHGTAPTTVKGRLTMKGVMFDVCIPFGHRKGKRALRPLAVESLRPTIAS